MVCWAVRNRLGLAGGDEESSNILPGGGPGMPVGGEKILRAGAVLGSLHCVAFDPKLALCLLTRRPLFVQACRVSRLHRSCNILIVKPRLRLVTSPDLPDGHVPINQRRPGLTSRRPTWLPPSPPGKRGSSRPAAGPDTGRPGSGGGRVDLVVTVLG